MIVLMPNANVPQVSQALPSGPVKMQATQQMPMTLQVMMPYNVTNMPQAVNVTTLPQQCTYTPQPMVTQIPPAPMLATVVSAPVASAPVPPVPSGLMLPQSGIDMKVVLPPGMDMKTMPELPSSESPVLMAEVVESPTSSGSPTLEGDLYVTMIELRHGRKRALTVNKAFSSGARVVIHNTRGKEMGTVIAQTPLVSVADSKSTKIKVAEEVSEALFHSFEQECEREERSALRLARKTALSMKIPINIHCATMQYERTRYIFHFTTEQDRPDFRKFIKIMRTKLGTSVWLNNCAPAVGSTGESVDQSFFS